MKIFKSKEKSKKAKELKSKAKSQKAKWPFAIRGWLFVFFIFNFLLLPFYFAALPLSAQTTEFTYQGRLLDSSLPPTANYDFEFSLWDSLANGTQLGTTQTKTGVAVSNGIFTVRLDFGNEFPGSARFIQIAVRPAGGGAYTLLAPRQPITNVPYAVKSISADVAAVADTATTANNAQNLGGVAANQYVVTTDPRMTDARTPTAGSPSYIQNTNSQQATSNFNISGDGTAGGTLSGQFVRASFGYDLFLQPFLRAVSSNSSFGFETGSANFGLANTYAGYRAGNAATSNASNNSFFGANAGRSNSNGLNNSFFGVGSGEMNSFGGFNAFFGNNSGAVNTIGSRNVFVGVTAGRDNIDGSDNVFVGGGAGQQNGSGGNNSIFGSVAGIGNTTGSNNSFFGRGSGNLNVTGTFNTAIGSGANVGAGDLTFATAIGAGALASTSNTIALGRNTGQDTVVVPGTLSVTGAINGTVANATNAANAVNANNANKLGGIAADSYLLINGDGSQLTNVIGAVRWQEINGNTQAVSNKGYIVSSDNEVEISLPPNPQFGDVVRVAHSGGTGNFFIKLNSGQTVARVDDGSNLAWAQTATNSTWTAIAASADGTNLIASTSDGSAPRIYTSTDSGATWVVRFSEASSLFTGVASSADGTKMVAVKGNGKIFTSTDSGITWELRTTIESCKAVASSADGTKLVVVPNSLGSIYTSTDSGITWAQRDNSGNRRWNSVASSADGNQLIAAAADLTAPERIYISDDSGITWVPSGPSAALWQFVASSADGTRLVAVSNLRIYISSDGGLTWINREFERPWRGGVASSANGKILMASYQGSEGRVLMTSSDYGATWKPQDIHRINWSGFASSADGTKQFGIADYIYVKPANSLLTGLRGSGAIELLYVGNGKFSILSSSGSIAYF